MWSLVTKYFMVKLFCAHSPVRPGANAPSASAAPPPSYAIVVTYLAGCDAVPQTAAAAADRLVRVNRCHC